ncbi:MAG: NAD(P)-dependent glycerol-3-phosphate dehydrogenase [Candidatus Dependentiae bacterium]|nr:NAD(P)-dependent glycerol-3-phosphate dehydrogenase [Candidatus Dependentiae bacterium]
MKYIYLISYFVSLSVYGFMNAEFNSVEHKLGIKTVENRQNKVTVLGEGAWGTAVALALADNGCDVMLWNFDATVAEHIKNTGYNQRYLPGVHIPASIKITTDLQEAIQNSDWIFETTPIQFLRAIVTAAKPYVACNQTWVALSKGIEENTLLLPTQIIADVLGKDCKVAVCAGPSFAKELAQKRITSIVVAEPDLTVNSLLPSLLASSYFRPYISTDMIGIQIGSALKNVLALGIGILDGAGYTDNAKAFLLSRGLHEMAHLAVAMGGKQETLYGLSGIGDLVLTCMGSSSKNLTVGRKLGAGQQLVDIIRETGFIPEGINTVKSVNMLMQKYAIELPICQGIHDVIDGAITIHEMMNSLMNQPLSVE